MTANTKTGAQLLTGLGQFIDDDHSSTTTGLGTATSLVDTSQSDFGEYAMADGWIRLTSGSYAGEVQRITGNDGSTTITVAPGFTGAVASGVTYEYHRWEPSAKLQALDRARFVGFPYLSTVVEDATVTTDGDERRFQFASTLIAGPYTAWLEEYLEVDPDWNALKNPKGDSLTGWTASAGTASIYTGGQFDRVIPKYDLSCTKIAVPVTTAVSYSQAVADMTGITAANAAGRTVTFGMWVYALLASRVTVKITDDTTSASSATHQGRGWEYLEASLDVAGDNATTLTPSLEVTSGAVMTVFWERSWFVLGVIPDVYSRQITDIRVQRDGSNQTVYMTKVLPEGYQLKLVGRGHLSALGEDTTATMEVDDGMAEVLYAYAARILFEEAGLSSEDSSVLAARIGTVLARARETKVHFDSQLANPPGLNTPYYGN